VTLTFSTWCNSDRAEELVPSAFLFKNFWSSPLETLMQEHSNYEEFWLSVESRLRRGAIDLFEALRRPATEEEVQAVEAEIGSRLHEEVRAAYLRHNGTAHHGGRKYERGTIITTLNTTAVWLPLAFALEDWRTLKEYHSKMLAMIPEAIPSDPGPWDNWVVRSVGWHESHFPIAVQNSTTRMFVNLALDHDGQAGQIFEFNGTVEKTVYAPSFNTLLGTMCDLLQAGTLGFSPSSGGLVHIKAGKRLTRIYPKIELETSKNEN
jgi:cell wall assembly regulator SMI1